MNELPPPALRASLRLAVAALLLQAALSPLRALDQPDTAAFCSGELGDGSASISESNGIRTWKVRLRHDGCELDLHAVGKVEFDDDFTDVTGVGRGGRFTLETVDRGVRRELDLRGRGTTLEREYRVDGRVHPWDDEARRWFASVLIALDRRTAVGVDSRLPKLLAGGGVPAVLAETAKMPSDYARGVYWSRLLEARRLTVAERRTLLEQAARMSKSDYYATELLKQVVAQGRLEDAGEREAVVAMIGRMDSDYYKSETVKAMVGGSLAGPQLSTLLDLTARMDSDYYKSETLHALIDGTSLDAAQRRQVLATVDSIDSDYYAAAVLDRVATRGWIGVGDAPLLVHAVGEMESDSYVGQVLATLIATDAGDDVVVPAVVEATRSMDSDYYRSEALVALLGRARLSEADLLRVVEATGAMDSDHYEAEVLKRVLAHRGASERVRAAVRAEGATLSKHYAGEVLQAAGGR